MRSSDGLREKTKTNARELNYLERKLRNISVQPATIFSSPGLDTKCACVRARVACLLRRSAKREKTKVRWPGSLSCRSIAAARAALSSSTPSPSPFFRSPCYASLRGDVIYSAEFTRVCKQVERKRCATREEKERDERESERRGRTSPQG